MTAFPYYGRTRTVLQLPARRSLARADHSEPEDCALHSESHRAEESANAAIMWERGMAAEGRAKRA